MTFSVPSAFAAEISASMPPSPAADVAVAAEPDVALLAELGGAGEPQAAARKTDRPAAATAATERNERTGTSSISRTTIGRSTSHSSVEESLVEGWLVE